MMKGEKGRGIMFANASVIANVSMQFVSKLISSQISPQYMLCLRAILLLIFNALLIKYSETQNNTQASEKQTQASLNTFNIKNRKRCSCRNLDFFLMLLRILWNSTAINCLMVCLQYVPLSITVVLLNLTPIFSFFIDAYLYKKAINKVQISLTAVSFCGVYLIFKPSPEQDWNPWMIFGIISALASCFNYVVIHSMKGIFKESIILQYAYIGQLYSNAIIICILNNLEYQSGLINDSLRSVSFWSFILLLTIFSYATQMFKIKALFLCKPSEIVIYSYTGVILSLFLDYYYFDKVLNFTKMVGLVLASTGIISGLAVDYFKG